MDGEEELDVVTVAQACQLLGVSRQAIAQAIRRGSLKAHRAGSIWLIRREDLAAYQPVRDLSERGRRGGRPRKTE